LVTPGETDAEQCRSTGVATAGQQLDRRFQSASMDRLLLSSLTIVVGVVPVAVFIGTMAGFGLARLAPRSCGFVYLQIVIGLTLPIEVVIIPLYYEVQWLGLLNTKFAIILPLIALFIPFSIYWMRAHFVNVPHEMSEAAEIGGATDWQQFWLVQVPLARPPSCRWRFCSSCGTRTRFYFGWCWSRCRSSGRWPVPSARSRANGAPTSRCSARGR
jgi:ABC-type glycerol-3-phosphate transport system permease component